MADIASFVVQNLAWEAISFGAGYGWQRLRRRVRPGRSISAAEANHAAVQRILSAHSTLRSDELVPIQVLQVGGGAVDVMVVRDSLTWEVRVKPGRTGLLLAAIISYPATTD